MENRREFLKWSAFGLATAALAASPASAAAEGVLDVAWPDAPPWGLLAPLAAGDPVGLGWRIAHLAAPAGGAVTLLLAHEDGRSARVDLCLRRGVPRGPAATDGIDFIVEDGGRGEHATDEALGRAVMRLARIVEANEARFPGVLAALRPHGDRVWIPTDDAAPADDPKARREERG